MSTKKKSIYNIISGIAGQLIIALVGLLIPRLVMVNFGSEVNGFLNSVTQIFQYVALLEAGVGLTTLQALYKPIGSDDFHQINAYLSATNKYYQKTSVIYFVVVIFFAVCYPFLIETEISRGTVFGVVFFMGMNGVINFWISAKYKLLLEADGKKYVLLNINTVVSLISNGIKIILLLAGYDILIVQGCFCLISIAQAVFINRYVKRNYGWLDITVKPDYSGISQKYSALVHQISGLIFGSTDVLIISVCCDLKMVSVYTMYSMVMNLASNLISQIGNGFVYRLGQLFYKDRNHFLKINRIFEVVNLAAVFSCFTVIYVLIIPFIRLYTRGITDVDYIDYRLPLLFVMVQLLSNGRSVMGNIINYAGKYKETQYRSILESVINLSVSFILVTKCGVYGVLIGTIVALLYRTNDIVLYVNHRILNKSAWKSYRGWMIDFTVFFILIWCSHRLPVSIDNYWQLMGYGIIWGIISVGVFAVVQIIFERKVILDLWELIKGLRLKN